METTPGGEKGHTAPVAIVAPFYLDPATNALYIHHDLTQVRADWEHEDHVAPINITERLGDVASWAAYVRRYNPTPAHSLLTWGAWGLKAVLDYHRGADSPGRCSWVALHDFKPSPEWSAWTSFASGVNRTQKEAIEFIEDHAADVVAPAYTDLMGLLRSLRANVASSASTELRADGTTSVNFSQDKTLRTGAGGSIELPGEIGIAIPVLRGHTDDQGAKVLYELSVRVRAAVADNAGLMLRCSIPTAERVAEFTYIDRVETAKALLGEDYPLLRSGG